MMSFFTVSYPTSYIMEQQQNFFPVYRKMVYVPLRLVDFVGKIDGEGLRKFA